MIVKNCFTCNNIIIHKRSGWNDDISCLKHKALSCCIYGDYYPCWEGKK